MTTPLTQSPRNACALRHAKERLADTLEHRIRQAAEAGGGDAVVRAEIPIEPVEALPWLEQIRGQRRAYWAGRDGAFEMAGVGAAEAVRVDAGAPAAECFAHIASRIRAAGGRVRYYGGLRFDPEMTPAGPWDALGQGQFILPRFEIVNGPSGCALAANAVLGPKDDPRRVLAVALMELGALPLEVPEAASQHWGAPARLDTPDREAWSAMVRAGLDAMRREETTKIVLARQSRFQFGAPPDPAALLRRLVSRTQDSYHFCFDEPGGPAFIGASPERLYKRSERRLESEALAGTRPRGTTAAEDEALGQVLLASGKDLREHRYVADALERDFNALCDAVQADGGVQLLKLHRCQHLIWRVEGTLRDGISDAAIVERLHPTPAVCGCPRDRAAAWIRELEGFDRGWYAGPVGWLGHGGAEFAVAIRSGLVWGRDVLLYSGAGIVDGSQPDDEWLEIENKMTTFEGCLAPGHE